MVEGINQFINTIIKCNDKYILNAYWCFVPALKDPGLSILPRSALPSFLF